MAKKDDKEKNKSPDSRPSKAGALKGARGNKGSKGDEGTLGYGTLDSPKGSSLGYGTLDSPKGSSLGYGTLDSPKGSSLGYGTLDSPKGSSLEGGTETDDTTTFSSSVTTDPSSNVPDPTGASQAETIIESSRRAKLDPTDEEIERRENISKRQDFASDLKNLSRRGALTTALSDDAKDRASELGITDGEYNSFVDRNDIRLNTSYRAPLADTQEEAIERVKYFQETGQGLKAFEARQDPKFKQAFNEGTPTSPLLEDSKPLEGVERRKANQIEREAKRIKDPAVRRALLLQAAQIRAGQPNITTPATKKAALDRNMQKRDVLKDTLEAGQQAAGSRGSSGAKGSKGSKGTVGRTEEDDELLGMTGGTSTYRPMAFTPVEVILREARSRRT